MFRIACGSDGKPVTNSCGIRQVPTARTAKFRTFHHRTRCPVVTVMKAPAIETRLIKQRTTLFNNFIMTVEGRQRLY